MPGAPLFEIGSEKWRPLGVKGPPKDENYT